MKGAETEYTFLRDALGNRFVSNGANVQDFSGKNLILTIDQTVQFIAERTLEDTVTEFEADSGIAIVMEPKSGALLAIAQYPFFNPNAYRKFKSANWRNRAITDSIEPGSTLKIFSATSAIEPGDFSPNTIFFCENGAYRIGRKIVRDVSAHGWLSLQQIVKYSSNIGAIKISEIVGAKHLSNTLRISVSVPKPVSTAPANPRAACRTIGIGLGWIRAPFFRTRYGSLSTPAGHGSFGDRQQRCLDEALPCGRRNGSKQSNRPVVCAARGAARRVEEYRP